MPKPRGRQPGFVMPESHRTKISNSKILNRLIDHAEGRIEMSATQVQAALGLLKKVLPDLKHHEHAGDASSPIQTVLSVTVKTVDP